ncbi:5-formyltetrahydrofolate cyclo-ligase [Leptobacterium flavescens]|uniref:5-formyltetrahydrofolate cyclo-ligase n=1 Tax=Leptobacterium flavescens TaxID=472055 RepID=A0A6P0UM79_9FLAO|nr:5-formyltetrahydrofolate cyclo-ligase [Leptobacterium flavescens]NER14451.1 5-formyltetrahydrofolate cyclo-ligase [Leptobacterium flavescens]
MKKFDLRKKYKLFRRGLSEELIDTYSIQIANQILTLPIWNKTYFHLFLSIREQKEVETSFILNVLQGKDKEVLISQSDFNSGEMRHFLLTDNTRIRKNKYNIPEPEDGIEISEDRIEVVFVPLLAFDKNGNRVGYGKGFYDRFLAKCRQETLKIGLSFFEVEDTIEDTDINDVNLDYCVTPQKVYQFF